MSFLISGNYEKLDALFLKTSIKILFSEELLNEIRVTILKPKLIKYFGAYAFEEMLLNFNDYIIFVEVSSAISVCRDEKDNFLLALAIDGDADFLITGDKDLLDLKSINSTIILTITEFLNDNKK